MRVAFPSGTRSAPFDRNPSTVDTGSVAEPVAGSTSTLATYTVPANRRAKISVQIATSIKTVLGAAQNADGTITSTPSGGGIQVVHQSQWYPTAPAQSRDGSPAVVMELKAGDLVLVQTHLDAGTGLIHASGSIVGVEYDA